MAFLERHQQILALNEFIKIKTAGVKLANLSRSLLDEIFIEEGKVDVRNGETLKLREHGKNGKKGSGKKSGKGKSEQGNQDAKDKAEKRKKDEEDERLKNWNDQWERKLKAQEILDDVPCCSAQGLILKPRTQSNIWIKVTKDKNIQDVQMAFMHVPVPKPKPPPLPKLVFKESLPEVEQPKAVKKKGKGNKKKKNKK